MSDQATPAPVAEPALSPEIVSQVRRFLRSRGRTYSLAMDRKGEVFCVTKRYHLAGLRGRVEYPLADSNLEAGGLDAHSPEAPAVIVDLLRHTPPPPPPFNYRRRRARHG